LYRVLLHPAAARFLEGLEEGERGRVAERLEALSERPRTSRAGVDIKKLKGTKGRPDLYRLRIGEYRAVHFVEEQAVWVTEIFPRSRGYR
jgi:mRNA interferase RelE/StbE